MKDQNVIETKQQKQNLIKTKQQTSDQNLKVVANVIVNKIIVSVIDNVVKGNVMKDRMAISRQEQKPKPSIPKQNNMIAVPGRPPDPVVCPSPSDKVLNLGGQLKTKSISRASPKHVNKDLEPNNKQNSGIT